MPDFFHGYVRLFVITAVAVSTEEFIFLLPGALVQGVDSAANTVSCSQARRAA
jgi:hypothetical protein